MRVLLTLSASLVVTGCTERQVHVTGVSGSIVWQVTDFRIVARSVQGTPRESIGNLKAFSPRSLRRPPPPAATPCSRHVRRPQRAAAAPPERPAARGSAVWTSGAEWARVAPQR